MTATDLDQQLENLLAVCATAQDQLQKTERARDANAAAPAVAREGLQRAEAAYASSSIAFGLGQTTNRPSKPNASEVNALAEDLELRAAGRRAQLATIARLESELAELLSARAAAEYTGRARALASSL